VDLEARVLEQLGVVDGEGVIAHLAVAVELVLLLEGLNGILCSVPENAVS